jgi:hypothetical protein
MRVANERGPSAETPEGEEEVVRRPRTRFQRQQDSEVRQVFWALGIDIDSVESVNQARADLDYLHNLREKLAKRSATIWSAIIASVVSLIIGGVGVLIANLIHTGKITP